MEIIHLVQRQVVDITLDVFHREKMAHHIQVHPTVSEARVIVYLYRADGRHGTRPGGKQLYKGLNAVEHAGGIVPRYRDPSGRHAQVISPGHPAVFPVGQHDDIVARVFFGQRQFITVVPVEIVDEIPGRLFGFAVCRINARIARNDELPLGLFYRHRLGNDVQRGRFPALLGEQPDSEKQKDTQNSRTHDFTVF